MAKQNLTMNKVKKQYNQIQQKHDYELKDGLNLTYSPIFPHGEIEKLIEEMGNQFKYANEKGIEITDEFPFKYILFLAIKYFTHLKKDISDKFEEQLAQMEWLVDTGYYKEICEDVFDQKEIKKIFDKAIEVSSKYIFMEKLTKQMQNEVQKLDIKNKDILEGLKLDSLQ